MFPSEGGEEFFSVIRGKNDRYFPVLCLIARMKNGRRTRLNCLQWIITSLYYFLFFRFNVHVSSGITSAVLRFKEGPIAMAKGFGLGYSLLYAMDKVSCSLCGNTVPIRCAMFHGS